MRTSAQRSDPLQGAFSPYPDEAYDQDEQENHHLQESKSTQRLELHRPREQEDGLHVEDYEQDGDNVVANGVTSAGAVYRIDAALVGHQFGFAGIVRPHQFSRQQRDRDQDADECDEDKDGNVILRHQSPRTSRRLKFEPPYY